ncbi:MAG: nucleotide sugar dehydrogenase [Candidatus Aenigmarchaeota archaeon]|nr:nucleotide sugar dehydrogenase [Candidatus Aenigmarchaeota archaeon]
MENLNQAILNKSAKVNVFGMGYVGIPLAIEIAKSGFKVHGTDRNGWKTTALSNGENPLTDLKEIDINSLKKLAGEGRMTFSQEYDKNSDIKMICVQTPMFPDRRPNLTTAKDIAKTIGKNLKRGSLIINESTVAPGMTRKVIANILEEESGLKAGEDFYLVASPERIDPGNTVYTINKMPKVIGGLNKESLELGVAFYSNFIQKVVPVSSLEAAEATKMLENSYRALNIGFINEFAKFCDAAGINVTEVVDAAATKPIGFAKHYPSIGVGGSCIPKDPYYLISAGEEAGMQFTILWNAMWSNESMPYYTFDLLKKASKENNVKLSNAKVVIFGIAYKGDVKDLRDSPPLVLCNMLKREGIKTYVYDPYFSDDELKKMELLPFHPEKESCDIVIIGCDHSQFKAFDYKKLSGLKFIIDGKNILQKMHVPVIGIGIGNKS